MSRNSGTKTEEKNKPKIIFGNKELENAIINWYGKRNDITVDFIMEEFRKILVKLGFVDGEDITLSDYDKESFSFLCRDNSSTNLRNARITLIQGDNENSPEITISTNEFDKNYRCVYIMEYKENDLRLQWYNIKNSRSGNTLNRVLSRYNWKTKVENNNGDIFSISVARPKITDHSGMAWLNFELKETKALEEYLLGLSFPINIEEVYRRCCETSLSPISQFPRLILTAEKEIYAQDNQVTDLVDIENGIIKKFTMTRDGKTISLDSSGSWDYRDANFSVSQDHDGGISYSLISLSEEEIFDVSPVGERYLTAKLEMLKVRDVRKSLTKK